MSTPLAAAPVIALATALAMAPAGGASGAPAEPDGAIEEIQVTATRRPAAADDVTAAVTLIDAEEITGAKLTTDALAAEPGVYLQQTTPGQGAAIVRGLKGSEILHLVDGLRMNNAIFRNAPTQYLALVSPGSVERIEILRGSPASLYGSDAVGGVLQVISRQPEFAQPTFGLRRAFGVSLDSAEQQRSLHVGMDAGNDRIAGLLSVDYLDTGDRRIGGGERIRPTGYSARAFRGALRYAPAEGAYWLLDLQHGEQPKTARIDELVAGFGQAAPASEEFFFAPNARSFVHLRHAREGGRGAVDWVVDAGWQRIVDDRFSRAAGSNLRRLEDNASDLFGIAVTASGEHAAGDWVAGAELYHDEVSSRRRELDLDSGDLAPVPPRFPDGSTVGQAALFVNADFETGNRHAVSGGLRFSAFRIDVDGTALSPAAELDLEDLSGDLGWRFRLGESTRLSANLGFGFRAPNVFDLSTLGERPGNRFNVPNPSLGAEKVTQIDVGIRHGGPRISAELVAWRFDYRDRITSVLTGEVTPDGRDVVQAQNRASAELWGLEGVARLLIGERASAELVVNYTRGEQDTGGGAEEPADRVPPLNGRLSLVLPYGDAWRVEPYLVFAARQDRLSARDVRDPRIDPSGTDGWATANLEARWRPGERWFLRLAATNLLDRRYRAHGSGLDAPGRNFALDLRYVW